MNKREQWHVDHKSRLVPRGLCVQNTRTGAYGIIVADGPHWTRARKVPSMAIKVKDANTGMVRSWDTRRLVLI